MVVRPGRDWLGEVVVKTRTLLSGSSKVQEQTDSSTYNLREGFGYFEVLRLLLVSSGHFGPLAGLLAAIIAALGRGGGGGWNRLQSRQSHRRGGAHGVVRVHAGAGCAAVDVHLGKKKKNILLAELAVVWTSMNLHASLGSK